MRFGIRPRRSGITKFSITKLFVMSGKTASGLGAQCGLYRRGTDRSRSLVGFRLIVTIEFIYHGGREASVVPVPVSGWQCQ